MLYSINDASAVAETHNGTIGLHTLVIIGIIVYLVYFTDKVRGRFRRMDHRISKFAKKHVNQATKYVKHKTKR